MLLRRLEDEVVVRPDERFQPLVLPGDPVDRDAQGLDAEATAEQRGAGLRDRRDLLLRRGEQDGPVDPGPGHGGDQLVGGQFVLEMGM